MGRRGLRWALCLGAIVAAGTLIDYHGGAASYLLFYSSLLIPLLSFVYSWIAAATVKVHFEPDKHRMVKGEHCPCTLSLINQGVLAFPKVTVRLSAGRFRFAGEQQTLTCTLGPHQRLDLPLELECFHCGLDFAGAEKVELFDLFGFHSRKMDSLARIGVLPRLPHLTDLVVAPGTEKPGRRSGWQYKPADMPDGQIRPYLQGDDLRRVHWKATALQGQLMMRSFVTEPKSEVVLIPDSRDALPQGQLGWTAQDTILEGVLAMADYYQRRGAPIRVLGAGGQSFSVSSSSSYQRLYEQCCGDFFEGELRPDTLLEQDIVKNGVQSSYVLITWELDEAFVRQLNRTIDLGAKVSLIYISDQEDGALKALLQSYRKVETFRVRSNTDILDLLGGTDLTGGVGA